MKKTLLLFSVISLSAANAQSITVDDTLSTGDKMNYYLADSSSNDFDAITGSGVTWDYSNLAFLDNTNTGTNLDSVIVASTAAFASNFTQSDYSEFFVNGLNTFFRNTPDSVITDGFFFNDGTNDYIVRYQNDPLITSKFPMNFGTTYTDPIDGEAIAGGQTVAISGSATIAADGVGTFLLAGNTYNNILRVKTVETLSGTSLLVGTVNITRTSYVYYDNSFSKMPIFIYGDVFIELGALGNVGAKTVWSKDPLNGFAGTDTYGVLPALEIYPNPASSVVNIETNNVESITLFNSIGETIKTITNPSTIESIAVDNLATGIYFVQTKSKGELLTKKLVIK